uniref:thioredoxin H-type-like n=1 Tax=Erigeron canadensis TaxID=72917 RepID=UPI001CB9401D|nr:thioredoxin H-type-like [Erigeron canadensis]
MGLCFSSSPTEDDEPTSHPHFAGGNVTLITTKDAWDRKVSESKTQGKIVVANFSASWCGPCKSIAPYYIELSEQHPSLVFLTVDVDELTEFSTQWEVKATPTFFFLRDGQQFDKLVGANKPELQKKITSIVDSQVPAGQK